MRLLVLDENHLLAWMVERLAPPGTEVVGFTSFDDARGSGERPIFEALSP